MFLLLLLLFMIGFWLWFRFHILYAKLIGIDVMESLAVGHITVGHLAVCPTSLLVQTDLLVVNLCACGAILVQFMLNYVHHLTVHHLLLLLVQLIVHHIVVILVIVLCDLRQLNAGNTSVMLRLMMLVMMVLVLVVMMMLLMMLLLLRMLLMVMLRLMLLLMRMMRVLCGVCVMRMMPMMRYWGIISHTFLIGGQYEGFRLIADQSDL